MGEVVKGEMSLAREKVLVKLDYHFARRTSAKTWWTYLNGEALPDELLVFSTAEHGKTHEYRYYVLPYGEVILRHRISNRGNYTKQAIAVRNLIADLNEIPPESREKAISLFLQTD